MKKLYFNYVLGVVLILAACQSKPKVIQPQNSQTQAPPSTHIHSNQASSSDQEVHTVMVEEFLHTSKYTYLNVSENDSKFWIAAPRMEVEKGETLHYQGALTMYDFESKEYNRTFDTLYLVGGVSREPIMSARESVNTLLSERNNSTKPAAIKIDAIDGGVTIKELFENKEKYAGKTIRVKGQCVKINRHIMGRNWVHLDDGSMPNSDLTITTNEEVEVGSVVVFEGKITLNKDFGSGYSYDIIMEEAVLSKGS